MIHYEWSACFSTFNLTWQCFKFSTSSQKKPFGWYYIHQISHTVMFILWTDIIQSWDQWAGLLCPRSLCFQSTWHRKLVCFCPLLSVVFAHRFMDMSCGMVAIFRYHSNNSPFPWTRRDVAWEICSHVLLLGIKISTSCYVFLGGAVQILKQYSVAYILHFYVTMWLWLNQVTVQMFT